MAESFLDRLFSEVNLALLWWPDPDFYRWDELDSGHGGESEEDMRRLAARANKTQLRQILKSANDSILMICLDNPSFGAEEAAYLVERQRAGPAVLSIIAGREWARDPHIAKHLCLDPKAPYHATRYLIFSLGESDLREISGSSTVSRALQKDCKRRLETKFKK